MKRWGLVTALAIVAAAASASPAAAVRQVAPQPLDAAVITAVLGQTGATLDALKATKQAPQVSVQRQAVGWAFGSGLITAPAVEDASPEAWLFVARKSARGWQVALDSSQDFGRLVSQAPEAIVSRGEKRNFAAHSRNAVTAAAAAPTGLSLPYPIGDSWALVGGPHGWSGQPRPWSSVDLNKTFGSGSYRVLAAQSGYAYFMCSNGGHIRIVHDNGLTTEYYHLAQEIRPPSGGQGVAMGDYLGMTSTRIPCGGSAGSNHVHFALKQSGSWVALAGKTIGGWTWFEGSSAYGGGARRGGQTVGVRGQLQNYGPETGRTFENATNVTIADLGQAESPITVSGVAGNAPTSLPVYVDIHHTWIGDLQIDLIAPDGTAYRLKNPNPDDDSDVLHTTYTVNGSAETANGTWKLLVKDVARNDSGYIDAWNLTF